MRSGMFEEEGDIDILNVVILMITHLLLYGLESHKSNLDPLYVFNKSRIKLKLNKFTKTFY